MSRLSRKNMPSGREELEISIIEEWMASGKAMGFGKRYGWELMLASNEVGTRLCIGKCKLRI